MRKPTPLLDQLSQAARDEAHEEMTRLDERWDRLSAGALSETENDELLGLADASGEAHEAYQAFKPLGPAFQQKVAAAILAQQTVIDPEPVVEDPQPMPAAVPATGMDRRKLFFGAFASAASLVMGAVLLIGAADPLPGFKRKAFVLASSARGETAPVEAGGAPIFRQNTEIPLIFEPETPAGDDLAARLYTLGPDARLQLTELEPSIEKNGSRIIFAPILGKNLDLAPGPWSLVVVIARPGKFPEDANLLAAVKKNEAGAKYWRVLVTPIQVAREK